MVPPEEQIQFDRTAGKPSVVVSAEKGSSKSAYNSPKRSFRRCSFTTLPPAPENRDSPARFGPSGWSVPAQDDGLTGRDALHRPE